MDAFTKSEMKTSKVNYWERTSAMADWPYNMSLAFTSVTFTDIMAE